MVSEISSLPTPVSPLISTVASVGPTTRTISSTRRRAALLPIIRGNPRPQSSALSSGPFATVSSSVSNEPVCLIGHDSIGQVVCAAILYPFLCPLYLFGALCLGPLNR